MASNLPQSIIYREDKMGFPVPLREWLSGPLKGCRTYSLVQNVLKEVFSIIKKLLIF